MSPLEKVPFATFYPLQMYLRGTCFFSRTTFSSGLKNHRVTGRQSSGHHFSEAFSEVVIEAVIEVVLGNVEKQVASIDKIEYIESP